MEKVGRSIPGLRFSLPCHLSTDLALSSSRENVPGRRKARAAAGGDCGGLSLSQALGFLRPCLSLACAQFLP